MFMDMLIQNALSVALGPGIVAVLFALAAWQPWSKTSELNGGYWGAPLAFAGAYLTGWIMINGAPDMMPSASGGYLVHVAVVIAAVGLTEALYRRDAVWLWGLKAVLMGAGLYLVISFMFANYWKSFALDAAYMVGIVGLGMLSMWTLEKMARRHPGATMPLVLHIMAAGAALVITFGHAASTGQQIGTLATATAVFLGVSWWKGQGRLSLSRGGVTVFTTLLVLQLATGYFNVFEPNVYGMITTPAIVASPLVLWIGEFAPISELSGWRGTLARAMLMASGTAVIVGVAFLGW